MTTKQNDEPVYDASIIKKIRIFTKEVKNVDPYINKRILHYNKLTK